LSNQESLSEPNCRMVNGYHVIPPLWSQCVALLQRSDCIMWISHRWSVPLMQQGVYDSWKSPWIWNCSWKCWKSPGIWLMWQLLLENFIISSVILACRVIFSTLCIGTSSGKQYHYDLREFIIPRSFVDITIFTCILILYGLSHKNLLEFFKNVSRISPGNGLGWICRHPVQDLSYNARMSHMCHICSWWTCLKRVVHHLDRKRKSLVVIVIAAAVATAV